MKGRLARKKQSLSHVLGLTETRPTVHYPVRPQCRLSLIRRRDCTLVARNAGEIAGLAICPVILGLDGARHNAL